VDVVEAEDGGWLAARSSLVWWYGEVDEVMWASVQW
jgi:hypothetical protein